MKLIRLAILGTSTPPPEGKAWSFRLGAVIVQSMSMRRTPMFPKHIILMAETQLPRLPELDKDGALEVPPNERRVCEHALETAANTVAVFSRSPRSLMTPWPPVAFIPESDADGAHLATARHIQYQHRACVGAVAHLELEAGLLSSLSDRLEGVASLADFFSTDNAVARYREAARLFEIAFALPTSQLEKKLAQFLSTGLFGYTREEVASWLLYRHGAVHGDGKKASFLTWESDVRPFMLRVEQAMLDVLFNKADWHDRSHSRRPIWQPPFGTSGAGGDVFVTQGVAGTLPVLLLDAWAAFPFASASLSAIPPEWWCKFDDSAERNLMSGSFTVRPATDASDIQLICDAE